MRRLFSVLLVLAACPAFAGNLKSVTIFAGADPETGVLGTAWQISAATKTILYSGKYLFDGLLVGPMLGDPIAAMELVQEGGSWRPIDAVTIQFGSGDNKQVLEIRKDGKNGLIWTITEGNMPTKQFVPRCVPGLTDLKSPPPLHCALKQELFVAFTAPKVEGRPVTALRITYR